MEDQQIPSGEKGVHPFGEKREVEKTPSAQQKDGAEVKEVGGRDAQENGFDKKGLPHKNDENEEGASGSGGNEKHAEQNDLLEAGGSGQNVKAPGQQQDQLLQVDNNVKRAYFECYTCHFRFVTKKCLRQHVFVHALSCLVCKIRFFNQDGLGLHLAEHDLEIPFHCNGIEIFYQP